MDFVLILKTEYERLLHFHIRENKIKQKKGRNRRLTKKENEEIAQEVQERSRLATIARGRPQSPVAATPESATGEEQPQTTPVEVSTPCQDLEPVVELTEN